MLPTFENFMRKDKIVEVSEILTILKDLTITKKLFWYVNDNLSRAISYLGNLEIKIENYEIAIRDQKRIEDKIILNKVVLESHERETIALYETIKNNIDMSLKDDKLNEIYLSVKKYE